MKSLLIKSSIAQPIIVVLLLACSLSCNNKNDCTQIVKDGDDTCFSVTYNNISTVFSLLSDKTFMSNKTLPDSAYLYIEVLDMGVYCSFILSDSKAYMHGVKWTKQEETIKLNSIDRVLLLRILSGVYITHDFNIILSKKPCAPRSDGRVDLKVTVYDKGNEIRDRINLSPETDGYKVIYTKEYDLLIYIIKKYREKFEDDVYYESAEKTEFKFL